jgi:tetratricopeptide (TPR) repeat protein
VDIQPVTENYTLQTEELNLIQSVQANPNSTDSLFALAEFYSLNRYYPNAIELLETVVEHNPQSGQAFFLLGKLLGSQKTDPEQSIEALQTAIALKPDSVPYREELVNVYNRLQRYPPALEQLDIILQLKPNDEDAQYRKAVILHTQGKVKLALEIVEQLPNHQHALVLKGIIQEQSGMNTYNLFHDIVNRYPENIRARYELGKQLMKQKKWDDAKQLFETIIDEDPFYQHALFQLVKIYQIQKDNTNAALAKQSLDTINRMGRDQRNEYRSYLQHHPDTAVTHFNMGLIYLEIGRGDLAAQEMHETITRNSQHTEAHFYLAQIFMSSGDFDKAIPILNDCIPIMENKAVIHSLLTQCYLELNDGENARIHLQTALQLNPNEPLAMRISQVLKTKTN